MTTIDLKSFLSDFSQGPKRNDYKPIVVMRNYEGLPETNPAQDIDIIVKPGELSSWIAHLAHAASKNSLSLTKRAQYTDCKKFHLSTACDNSLEIDIVPRFWWRGITWLETEEVIKSAKHLKSMIWHPSPAHEFIITFTHSYLYGGFYPLKYKNRLNDLLREDATEISNIVTKIYGVDDGLTILGCIRHGHYSKLNDMSSSIRIRCIFRYLRKRPLQLLWGLISSYVYDIYLKTRS